MSDSYFVWWSKYLVAERLLWVETLDQLKTVTLAGCEEVQGFYFSKPVPAGDIKSVLAGCQKMLRVDRKRAAS